MRPHHKLLAVPLISALLVGVTACGSSDSGDKSPRHDAHTNTDATQQTASPTTEPTPSEPSSKPKRDEDAESEKEWESKAPTPSAKPAAKPTSRATMAPSQFCAAVADLGDTNPPPAADATPQLMRKLGSDFKAVAALAPTSTIKEAWSGYAQVFMISADIKEGTASTGQLLAVMPNLDRWQSEMSSSIASCAR